RVEQPARGEDAPAGERELIELAAAELGERTKAPPAGARARAYRSEIPLPIADEGHRVVVQIRAHHLAALALGRRSTGDRIDRLDVGDVLEEVVGPMRALRRDARELLGRVLVVDATAEEIGEIGALLGARGLGRHGDGAQPKIARAFAAE